MRPLSVEEAKKWLPKKHHLAIGILSILLIVVVRLVVRKVIPSIKQGIMDDDKQIESNNKGVKCHNEACQRNEERIGYLIDETVEPCEDFFQYACSSKKRGKIFPYAREDVTLNLTDLIVKTSGDLSFLKDFYESCVSISEQFTTEEVAQYCLKICPLFDIMPVEQKFITLLCPATVQLAKCVSKYLGNISDTRKEIDNGLNRNDLLLSIKHQCPVV